MTRRCSCGGPIVECGLDHRPSDLCRGWRHVYSDPALFHSIVCPTSGTGDDVGWSIAYPADEAPWHGCALSLAVGLLVLVVTLALAVAVTR